MARRRTKRNNRRNRRTRKGGDEAVVRRPRSDATAPLTVKEAIMAIHRRDGVGARVPATTTAETQRVINTLGLGGRKTRRKRRSKRKRRSRRRRRS